MKEANRRETDPRTYRAMQDSEFGNLEELKAMVDRGWRRFCRKRGIDPDIERPFPDALPKDRPRRRIQ